MTAAVNGQPRRSRLRSRGARVALAATAVAGCLLAISKCGGQHSAPTELGNVTLSVQLPAQVPIGQVSYQLQNARAKVDLKGTLSLDELARATAAVRRIPVGKPWTATFSAASADGDVSCAGSASFDVLAEQTTVVSTVLPCQSRTNGPLKGGPSRRCTIIQTLAVAPTQTAVGGALELGVQTLPGERLSPLQYAWSGAGGSFSDAGRATTVWTCREPGEHTLALRVWDEACADRAAATVRCTSLACGNGLLDPDETCEPPGTSSCDRGCRKVAGCGNASIDPGEQCDDGNTSGGDGCTATCTRESICGNGLIEAGEECEPPGAGSCSSSCRKLPGL
jgi:cysteine-rich repeat protein